MGYAMINSYHYYCTLRQTPAERQLLRPTTTSILTKKKCEARPDTRLDFETPHHHHGESKIQRCAMVAPHLRMHIAEPV